MPSRIGYWLAFSGAAAGLAWLSWPGAPTDPATLINRVDVVAIVVMLAVLPWAAARLRPGRHQPGGAHHAHRRLRGGVRACPGQGPCGAIGIRRARRTPGACGPVGRRDGLPGGGGGLYHRAPRRDDAADARSPGRPGHRHGAGIAAGLAMYALPPLAHPPQVANAWLTGAYGAARVLVVPLVAGAGIAAGLLAARRTSGRGSQLPLADARARQGVAAGLCAGAAAALVVSVLGISTIALLPQEAARLQWALPRAHAMPGSLYAFEVSLSDSAAGHLLILDYRPAAVRGPRRVGRALRRWTARAAAWRRRWRRWPLARAGAPAPGRRPAPRRRCPAGSIPASRCRASPVGDGLPQPSEADRPAPGRPERMPSQQRPDGSAAASVQRRCQGRQSGNTRQPLKPFR